jgi:superfamily II DNA or RNA helicase
MNVITKLGYSLKLDEFTDKQLENLKKELTVKPHVMEAYDFGQVQPFPVFRLSEKRIYVPKFFGIEKYGPAKKMFKNEEIEMKHEFTGSLLPHQTEICDTILNKILTNDSCIAALPTGQGKTIIALWISAQIKKRTLILVHKEFLANQWADRIKQFIPGATIGFIQQDKCEIENDFVIGMIQTIVSRDFSPATFNSFSLTVYDETHHIAACSFSKTLFTCGSRYTLGLSATPERKDGLTKILEWSLGDIISNTVASDVETPIVEFINAEYSSKIVPKYNFRSQLNSPNLINQLVADNKRNDQIIDKIVELTKIGRKILVLSGRRNHCDVLMELLKLRDASLITGLYMGGMKQKDLDESNLADIIFATYSAVSEAYDNPKLDTLVMATGMGDVTQSIGRILRRKNKFRPLVVDVTDKEFCMGQSRRRVAFYKKNNYVLKGVKNTKPTVNTEKYMFVDD